MAIQKEKTLSSGVTGNYWRITTITVDSLNMKIVGQISLFKDQTASNAGKSPMAFSKTFRIPLNLPELLAAENIIAYMYEKIQDAADVVVTKDILGHDLPNPTTVAPDLSGGTPVL